MRLRATRLTAIASAVRRFVTPASLFANGEQGVWYDPSDFKPDWRYNLLSRTEQFDDAVWTKVSATVAPNATTAPDGSVAADKLVESVTSVSVSHDVRVNADTVANSTMSIYAKSAGRRYVKLYNAGLGSAVAFFDLLNGEVVSEWTTASASIADAENGWYRCSVVAPLSSSGIGLLVGSAVDSSGNHIGDGTSGIYIWGASLTTAANADKPYQRITDGVQDYYDAHPQPVLFQDAAGNTPVTAVEQPVGLMLDKSKGLVLGPELVANGTFDANTAGWAASTSSVCTWSSGRAAIATIPGASGIATLIASQGMPTTIGKRYAVSMTFDKGSVPGSNSRITISNNADGSAAFFATTLGVFGSGTLRATFVATASTTYIAPRMEAVSEGQTWYIDNISVRELPGNHAFQTTSTSRPVLKQDAGGQYYLKFDGVDDGMVTNSIDFTATDKMTVFAGVRTLASSVGILAELSANISSFQGTFFLSTLDTGGADGAALKLNDAPTSFVGYTPSTRPVTYVASIAFDSSTNTYSDQIKYRANTVPIVGTDVTPASGPRNFTSAPLYIGRRGGTTLPFNGHIYGLIVRGAATTDAKITQTEKWLAKKTGVAL